MVALQKKFKEEIVPKLQQELGFKNVFAVPKIQKIVLNMGLKDALKDPKVLEEAVSMVSLIAGQKPVVTRAKKAIAGFKLRKGDQIGVMVTLRGNRMYDFFEKLVGIVLPRVKDFHGVSTASFDGSGNYSLGFSEMSVFPEIDTARTLKNFGIQLTINTTAKNNDEAKKLLELLGMPFRRERSENKGGKA